MFLKLPTTQSTYHARIKPKILSVLSPNPTRKARPVLRILASTVSGSKGTVAVLVRSSNHCKKILFLASIKLYNLQW